jgi:membrane protein DedA with SNARE-associated domain
VFNTLLDWISGSDWTYGAVFLIALLDAFFPVVPSETAVITAGVLAGAGDLSLALVIPAAAAGAYIGDNISYGLGRFLGHRIVNRFFHGERSQKTLRWAEEMLERRGGLIFVVARFIPGGRTAATFSAGFVDYPWRRFLVFDGIGVAFWALYASLLGYFGGKTFEERTWLALLVAFAIAGGLTLVIEGIQRLRERRAAA